VRRAIACFLLSCLGLHAAPTRADYAQGLAAEQRGDRARALIEYVAAANDDARAALALARLHEEQGGAQDQEKALRWLRRAGELGDAEAQYRIGLRYLHGVGAAAREPREAVGWLERAAAGGHAAAAFELGRLLADGPAAQPGRARALIERAADAGVREAQAWLGRDLPAAGDAGQAGAAGVATPPPSYAERKRYHPEPRITLGWGIHHGYGHRHGHWGWSFGNTYPWYPYSPYAWYPWGGPAWGWSAHACPDPWCPGYRHAPGGVRFGFGIGN